MGRARGDEHGRDHGNYREGDSSDGDAGAVSCGEGFCNGARDLIGEFNCGRYSSVGRSGGSNVGYGPGDATFGEPTGKF